MTWDSIYKTRGVVQSGVMQVINELTTALTEQIDAGELQHPRILDAGCGTGRHAIHLAQTFSEATVHCCDNAPTCLELLAKQAAEAGILNQLRITDVDIDANLGILQERAPFDAVLSTLVIHHGDWKTIAERFANLYDMLKVGGYFAFAAISESDSRSRTGYEIEPRTRLDTAQDDGDVPHHFFNEENLDTLFAGCQPMWPQETVKPSVTGTGDGVHWEVLARKGSATGS